MVEIDTEHSFMFKLHMLMEKCLGLGTEYRKGTC